MHEVHYCQSQGWQRTAMGTPRGIKLHTPESTQFGPQLEGSNHEVQYAVIKMHAGCKKAACSEAGSCIPLYFDCVTLRDKVICSMQSWVPAPQEWQFIEVDGKTSIRVYFGLNL